MNVPNTKKDATQGIEMQTLVFRRNEAQLRFFLHKGIYVLQVYFPIVFGDKRLCYALNDMICKFLKATMKENYFHDFLFIFLPYLVHCSS